MEYGISIFSNFETWKVLQIDNLKIEKLELGSVAFGNFEIDNLEIERWIRWNWTNWNYFCNVRAPHCLSICVKMGTRT